MVGIVTVDDAMDVMVDEATEDITKMAAISPSEKPYMETSVFLHAKNRIPWLLILMLYRHRNRHDHQPNYEERFCHDPSSGFLHPYADGYRR